MVVLVVVLFFWWAGLAVIVHLFLINISELFLPMYCGSKIDTVQYHTT